MLFGAYPHHLSAISHGRRLTFGYLLGCELAGVGGVAIHCCHRSRSMTMGLHQKRVLAQPLFVPTDNLGLVASQGSYSRSDRIESNTNGPGVWNRTGMPFNRLHRGRTLFQREAEQDQKPEIKLVPLGSAPFFRHFDFDCLSDTLRNNRPSRRNRLQREPSCFRRQALYTMLPFAPCTRKRCCLLSAMPCRRKGCLQ